MSNTMERRKLFSSTTQRRKLFSEPCVEDVVNPEGEVLKAYRCQDCGYILETKDTTTSMVCPKCGGKRFLVECESEVKPEEKETEKTYSETKRRKLFSADPEQEEREFSENISDLESKLKIYSGKTISDKEFEKEFSALDITADDLEARNFAKIDESGNVEISQDAYIQSRLFSKITISITKELDLDPEIMSGCPKESIIDNLSEHADLGPKGIILIKKAHAIPVENENNTWISDSGISRDLPAEFGGENKSIEDFKRTLDERYPDAPENILDLLSKHGVIKMNGGLVEIKNK